MTLLHSVAAKSEADLILELWKMSRHSLNLPFCKNVAHGISFCQPCSPSVILTACQSQGRELDRLPVTIYLNMAVFGLQGEGVIQAPHCEATVLTASLLCDLHCSHISTQTLYHKAGELKTLQCRCWALVPTLSWKGSGLQSTCKNDYSE